MIIVGIDPGDTSGLCVVNTDERTVSAQSLDTHELVVQRLRALVQDHYGSGIVVLIEDFVGSGRRDTHIVNTIKLLGFCHYYAQAKGVLVRVQSPQFRKGFVEDAKTKFPFKNHAQSHPADAYAHVLAYLTLINSWGLDDGEQNANRSAQIIDSKLTRCPY